MIQITLVQSSNQESGKRKVIHEIELQTIPWHCDAIDGTWVTHRHTQTAPKNVLQDCVAIGQSTI